MVDYNVCQKHKVEWSDWEWIGGESNLYWTVRK